MDSTFNISDISPSTPVNATAVSIPEDDLAFFSGLWFLIPTALAVWSGLIWAVTRFI